MFDQFQRPYLLFLIIPLLFVAFYQWKSKKFGGVLLIQSDRFQKQNSFLATKFRFVLLILAEVLFYIAGIFLVIAAAGPGEKYKLTPDSTSGIDIMIALDISGSMVNSYDFLPKTDSLFQKNYSESSFKKII